MPERSQKQRGELLHDVALRGISLPPLSDVTPTSPLDILLVLGPQEAPALSVLATRLHKKGSAFILFVFEKISVLLILLSHRP